MALLAFRGDPRSGGQGVYVARLSRALCELGHTVEVLSGPPVPELDPRVTLRAVGGLDLYRQPDPFRTPRAAELRDPVSLLEFLDFRLAGGYPEPLAFSLRAARNLVRRRSAFDIVHDNQGLGFGLLALRARGFPLVATVHHPIAIDRRLAEERAPTDGERFLVRRFYGFAEMQAWVARRLPAVLTVSSAAARDITAEMGVRPDRIRTVPLGVDSAVFAPRPEVRRVPGRLVTMATPGVELKGLPVLLEAVARLRRQRPEVHLIVLGRRDADEGTRARVDALGLTDAVRFAPGLEDSAMVALYASAEVAVVPSLYEGFSLPTLEAMACGCPLVVTDGAAIAEVAGADEEAACMVPARDPDALAAGLGRVLGDPTLRRRLGDGGRRRAVSTFSWEATARATVRVYREVIAGARGQAAEP